MILRNVLCGLLSAVLQPVWTPVGAALPPLPVSNDPNILWGVSSTPEPFTSTVVEPTTGAYNNLYFYEGSNGKVAPPFHSSVGYWIDADTAGFGDVIHDDATAFTTGQYLVKYEVVTDVTGHAGEITLNYATGQAGVWVDLFRANIELDALVAGTRKEVVIAVTVATDDGFGAPVPGSEGGKYVTLISERQA